MSRAPLMPKATAVWLVDNTSLTFEQIATFCALHVLEVKGIADGDVAHGIKGMDPITSGQLTREEIRKGQDNAHESERNDSQHRQRLSRRIEEKYQEEINAHHRDDERLEQADHRLLGLFGFTTNQELHTRPVLIQIEVINRLLLQISLDAAPLYKQAEALEAQIKVMRSMAQHHKGKAKPPTLSPSMFG